MSTDEASTIKVAGIFINGINNNSIEDYSIVQNNIEKKDLYNPQMFNIISPTDFIEYSISFAVPCNHQELAFNGKVNILASYIADKVLGGTILIVPNNEEQLPQIIVSIQRILQSINFESAKVSLDHAVQQLQLAEQEKELLTR